MFFLNVNAVVGDMFCRLFEHFLRLYWARYILLETFIASNWEWIFIYHIYG